MSMRSLLAATVLVTVGTHLPVAAQAQTTASAVLQADWDTLDPHRTRSTNGQQMAVALYDRVVALGAGGKIVPYLAESWDASGDGTVLRIRQGATCSDGTAITATVVANSMKRLADPDTKAPYAGRTFGRGTPTITADDAARTVTIKLAQPNSDLMLALAMPWSSVVCPAGIASGDALQGTPQGSGPYTLSASARGDRYTLAKRANYTWGPATAAAAGPLPDTLVLRVSPNATTTANLIVTGEVNLISITGRDVERLAKEAGLKRTDVTLFGADGLLYSQADGRVTADPKVRLALSHAIDPVAFNRAFAFGLATPVDTLTTPSMQCYDPAVGSANAKFDVARAHALLGEAGYKRNAQGLYEKDGKTLKIRIAGSRTQNAGPELLLEQWKAIGVDASLTMAEFNTWLETITKTADWEVTVMPYNSVIPSPSLFVAQITGAPQPNGPNYMGKENPAYAAAAQAALAAAPADRCAKWAAAERIVLESGDSKPLVARNVSTFTRGLTVEMISGTVFDPHTLRIVR